MTTKAGQQVHYPGLPIFTFFVSLAWSPDSKSLAAVTPYGAGLRVVNAATGELLIPAQFAQLFYHKGMREHHPIREVREWRRLRTVALYEEGWLEVLIAEALDVYKGTVSRWLAIAKASGIEALLGHTGAGHPHKLTLEQLAIVPELLWHGDSGKWSCHAPCRLIGK